MFLFSVHGRGQHPLLLKLLRLSSFRLTNKEKTRKELEMNVQPSAVCTVQRVSKILLIWRGFENGQGFGDGIDAFLRERVMLQQTALNG